MKEEVKPDMAEEINNYINKVSGSNVTLSDGQQVTILKGGVREQRGKSILIYRYQLNM
ncbi:hypothetical protein [Dethiothermospora halolimnae]|uniref:hypothetical protein n=1 Tax=Dethiothermospora halolimnae TaxID=3114390 RepID=UPI003CCBE604